MKDLAARDRLNHLDQELPLQLKHLRHVRIMFMDTNGQLTVVSPQRDHNVGGKGYVPSWFAALVRPQLVGRSAEASDTELARRLWTASERLTGVTFPL